MILYVNLLLIRVLRKCFVRNFRDFSMFYQIFLSPQVKRCAIITYKHGIYELPHYLPNDLKLRILGN